MYEAFFQYIKRYTSIPLAENEVELIEKSFIPRKFKKRQFFLQEGDVCKYTAFIVRGAMRQYRVDDDGEHIIKLYIENWWANDRESFMNQSPSKYFIDAWEDTEALLLTKAAKINLVDSIPALSEWIRILDANFAIASQRRLNAAISFSAEKRYHDLEENYPEFLQRFPQQIIASYLGITRETLNRIITQQVKQQ
jgi:CRP-like cAMP-binding protein